MGLIKSGYVKISNNNFQQNMSTKFMASKKIPIYGLVQIRLYY